jgi:large subunit ribosomal protein L25
MADTFTLKAEERKELGTRRARRLRNAGQVPAVLSHKKEKPLNLLINAREFERILQKRARILELQHPAGQDKVFIKEVQWDHLGERLVHVDFTKVAKDELLTLEVPLELKGKPVGVSEEGGVLDQYVRTLKIQCTPDAIPDRIEHDVTSLKKDHQLHVSDLKAPAGVKILNDAAVVIAAVTEHKLEEVTPAAVATPGPTEPEVIKKEKAEEAGEEGEGAKKEAKKEDKK